MRARSTLLILLGLATALLVPLRAPAQQTPQQSAADRIKEQKDELDKIRQERADLQKRMQDLQSTVHDLAEERTNIERQADATARVVRGLDHQLSALSDEETEATGNLIRAQDELAIKRAVLRNRVREIYKRGPLYSVEAMLSAQSFGELVARYKYLHIIAQRDRALVSRVEALGQQITNQRQTLVMLRNDVEDSRQQKATEEQQLRTLDEQRARSLAQAQAKERQAESRLAQIAKDEARVGSVIAALEAERKRAEVRGGSAVSSNSTLKTSDFGRLDWPVEGTIIYQFGRLVNPNNTTIRWDGIGIAAPEGTPVKAVAAGTVALVSESLGTYGRTVILQHGGNDYSIYSSLGKILVAKGTKVTKGQVIGTVGQSDPDMEPHLHFEMRPGQRAVDPLEWLRSRK
ncbi:MAG: murein hydrolase activator EnvC family protein [Gemmatimonadaceae bacterium]